MSREMPTDKHTWCRGSLKFVETPMHDDGAWSASCPACGAFVEVGYAGLIPEHLAAEHVGESQPPSEPLGSAAHTE